MKLWHENLFQVQQCIGEIKILFVDRAALQIPLLFISRSTLLLKYFFKTPFLPDRKGQDGEFLTECSSPTMCHISHVTCHFSQFIYMYINNFFIWTMLWSFFVECLLSTGLPCLVIFSILCFYFTVKIFLLVWS